MQLSPNGVLTKSPYVYNNVAAAGKYNGDRNIL